MELTNTWRLGTNDVLDRERTPEPNRSRSCRPTQTQLEQNRLSNDKALVSIDYDIIELSRALERRDALTKSGMLAEETGDTVRDEARFQCRKLRPLQARGNEQQNQLRVQQLPQISAQLMKLQQDIGITRRAGAAHRACAGRRLATADGPEGRREPGSRYRLVKSRPTRATNSLPRSMSIISAGCASTRTGTIEFENRQVSVRVRRAAASGYGRHVQVELEFEGEPPPGLLAGQGLQGRLALGNDSPARDIAGRCLSRRDRRQLGLRSRSARRGAAAADQNRPA